MSQVCTTCGTPLEEHEVQGGVYNPITHSFDTTPKFYLVCPECDGNLDDQLWEGA